MQEGDRRLHTSDTGEGHAITPSDPFFPDRVCEPMPKSCLHAKFRVIVHPSGHARLNLMKNTIHCEF